MLRAKMIEEKDDTFRIDVSLDMFFQEVSIEDCKEVLQTLWNKQLNPKISSFNKAEAFKVVNTTREIAKALEDISYCYQNGNAKYLRTGYAIEPLIIDYSIDQDFDDLMLDFLAEEIPSFSDKGLSRCRSVANLLYYTDVILDRAHELWLHYVKKQDALEVVESNVKPIYCQPMVYE
jgi:hypothetical protein